MDAAGAGTRRDERPGPNTVVDFGPVRRWSDDFPLIDEGDRCDGFPAFRRDLLRLFSAAISTA